MTSITTETTKIRMMLPFLIDQKEELAPATTSSLMWDSYIRLTTLDTGRVPFEKTWANWLHDNAQDIHVKGVSYIIGKEEVESARRLLENTIEVLDERLDEEGIEYGE